jgi:hypothetical protein
MSERLSSLTDRDAWSDCVIDMRCRPAYLHDFFGATPGSAGNETAKWLNQRVGTRGNLEHYAAGMLLWWGVTRRPSTYPMI